MPHESLLSRETFSWKAPGFGLRVVSFPPCGPDFQRVGQPLSGNTGQRSSYTLMGEKAQKLRCTQVALVGQFQGKPRATTKSRLRSHSCRSILLQLTVIGEGIAWREVLGNCEGSPVWLPRLGGTRQTMLLPLCCTGCLSESPQPLRTYLVTFFPSTSAR